MIHDGRLYRKFPSRLVGDRPFCIPFPVVEQRCDDRGAIVAILRKFFVSSDYAIVSLSLIMPQ
jgi:hypothetical protein